MNWNVTQKILELSFFGIIVTVFFFRWDEESIELAQTWMPKDMSKFSLNPQFLLGFSYQFWFTLLIFSSFSSFYCRCQGDF